MDAHAVMSVSRWARFSLAMRDAHCAGLAWLVPVYGELVLVPMPVVRTATTKQPSNRASREETAR